MNRVSYQLEEFASLTGLEETEILKYIKREWLIPLETQKLRFDEEDQARINLIKDLIDRFGVNDQAVEIILHLIDQIHFIRRRIDSAK